MNMLYCIEHEEMVKAQKGNPTPFIHEVWVETDLGAWTKKELDWCEFPMGYTFSPPPPSLAKELDTMPFEKFEAWCNDNDPELQMETLIQN